MFIDDEGVIAKMVKAIWEQLGYQVTAHTERIEALFIGIDAFTHKPIFKSTIFSVDSKGAG